MAKKCKIGFFTGRTLAEKECVLQVSVDSSTDEVTIGRVKSRMMPGKTGGDTWYMPVSLDCTLSADAKLLSYKDESGQKIETTREKGILTVRGKKVGGFIPAAGIIDPTRMPELLGYVANKRYGVLSFTIKDGEGEILWSPEEGDFLGCTFDVGDFVDAVMSATEYTDMNSLVEKYNSYISSSGVKAAKSVKECAI